MRLASRGDFDVEVGERRLRASVLHDILSDDKLRVGASRVTKQTQNRDAMGIRPIVQNLTEIEDSWGADGLRVEEVVDLILYTTRRNGLRELSLPILMKHTIIRRYTLRDDV